MARTNFGWYDQMTWALDPNKTVKPLIY